MRWRSCIVLAATLIAGIVHAAEFPLRPVRMILPFGAGGASDIVGRILAAEVATRTGQPVVVENKPGADGNIAADYVAKSAADGYTLLMGTSTLAIVRTLYANLTYDLQRDLAPVINVGSGPFVITVNAQSPVKSLAELIATAKARPRKLNFASAATGSSTHLAGELFNSRSGIEVQHVGYKSEPQALAALLAEEVVYTVASYGATTGFLQNGRIRAIAVTSPNRIKLLPDVPSVSEAGLPGFDAGFWNGIFAPGKTSPEIVERLYIIFAEAARTPQVTERLENFALRVDAIRPQAFSAQIAADIDKWAAVIKAAKVSPQ